MSRRSSLVLGLVGTIAALAMGQDFDRDTNAGITITVEGSYLQESIDLMIIRQQSRAENRELKFRALKNIKTAIDQGITDGEVLSALEYMALEGIVNKTVYNNRIRNNYPDIRGRAAAYLGGLGSPDAQQILLKMAQAEYEPMILTEVVKSLTKIGINDNNETVRMITKRLKAFDVLLPDNLLALAALEAYETFAYKDGGKLDTSTVQVIRRISEGRYHGIIRERAKQFLTLLHTYSPPPP
ncbi:MAG: HEAT repeat domain-containing protein [Treponema sp.]|nr:HEAT repeat domain-containing protein [Treponema sp.]